MKMKLVAGSVLSLMMTAPFAQEVMRLKHDTDKISYAIGYDLGKTIESKKIPIQVPAMCKGISDGMNGNGNPLLTAAEMKDTLDRFQKSMMVKATADFEILAQKNLADGQAFLLENKDKPGVVTLPSGLQYKIITKGKGEKPKLTDTVTVEYEGKLRDGTVFDSTEKSGQPATFSLNQVIPGWTEGLQLMSVGSNWELFVPANLAYGARSVGNAIGPNETLIFKVKLLSIAKPEKNKK